MGERRCEEAEGRGADDSMRMEGNEQEIQEGEEKEKTVRGIQRG